MSGKTKKTAYLGVDIGTTSIAAVAVDGRDGSILKTFSVPNPSAGDVTADGRDEQDADAITETVNALIRDCETAVAASGREPAGIGWTGQMHGLVGVDADLRAVTPFVTWRDARCAPPSLGAGIMDDWLARGLTDIRFALTIPGYVIARRTGRCMVDPTFRASMGTDDRLARYARWIPETDDSLMIGDNQAGVFAAQKIRKGAPVINIGTSGQFSVVVDGSAVAEDPSLEERPFRGGFKLFCRASHVGGAALARLRASLGCSWSRFNDEAETDPRIAACMASVIDDIAKRADIGGKRTVVGVGNALRLNPALRKALEKRLKVRCVVPDVEEMAAWGAALHAIDRECRK